MATSKTATLTFRIEPGLKEALRIAADQEHRSIANMIEVLIRDYCEQRGIATEQQLRWWARYRDVNGLIESGAMVEKRPNPTSRRPQLYVVVPRIVEWMATPSRKAGAA